MIPDKALIDLGIGILGGVVGGLAGIGGSIVMLPALALFHGYDTPDKNRHHVYMAASMVANIAVSLSATLQHRRKKATRNDLMAVLAPSMCVGIVLGVFASSQSPGKWAVYGLAAFIWAYCAYVGVTLVRKLPQPPEGSPTPAWWKLAAIGVATGVLAGFLGVGGGILLVPLLQISGLPLRHAIAGSASVMWISATIGAGTKLWLLPGQGLSVTDAVAIAAPMSLGAVAGAWFGAWLSHKLKVPALKVVIIVVLALAAVRLVV
jgi:uncharacterized membrane protein YfcA